MQITDIWKGTIHLDFGYFDCISAPTKMIVIFSNTVLIFFCLVLGYDVKVALKACSTLTAYQAKLYLDVRVIGPQSATYYYIPAYSTTLCFYTVSLVMIEKIGER